jgi:site-specific recombinase XerD
MPLLEPRPSAAALTPGSSADKSDGPDSEAAAALRAFLAELAAAHVSERSARLYVGHLGRFAAWLRAEYRAGLLVATAHDVRAYRTRLAGAQKPASVNGALAARRRFYRWAHAAGRVRADPTARVRPAAQQPLAPKGCSAVERRRLVREAERAGAMASAVVATLLHTGLRAD